MKRAIWAVALFVIPLSTASQQKPLSLSDLTMSTAPLTFVVVPNRVILTCQSVPTTSSYQPEDFYDCKMANGTTLDGLVRFWMRQQRLDREAHEAERASILKAWKDSIPKPIKRGDKFCSEGKVCS